MGFGIVWTLTSNGYKYYTLNLLESLKKKGVQWPLHVYCADRASYTFFKREGWSDIYMVEHPIPDTGAGIVKFGTDRFQTLNRKKLDQLRKFALDEALDYCIYMDGDIAVYRDFLPDILERLRAEDTPGLLAMCDEYTDAEPCSGLGCKHVCSGFLAWRRGGVPADVFRVHDVALWAQEPEDQRWINRALRAQGVKYAALPRDLYPNGIFRRRPAGDAFLLHYNYIVGDAKQKAMKLKGDWGIPY